MSSPSNDHLCIATRGRPPLAAADGPLSLAEALAFLTPGPHAVEGRDEVSGAVGQVGAARDRGLVQVHGVRVLEARVALGV